MAAVGGRRPPYPPPWSLPRLHRALVGFLECDTAALSVNANAPPASNSLVEATASVESSYEPFRTAAHICSTWSESRCDRRGHLQGCVLARRLKGGGGGGGGGGAPVRSGIVGGFRLPWGPVGPSSRDSLLCPGHSATGHPAGGECKWRGRVRALRSTTSRGPLQGKNWLVTWASVAGFWSLLSAAPHMLWRPREASGDLVRRTLKGWAPALFTRLPPQGSMRKDSMHLCAKLPVLVSSDEGEHSILRAELVHVHPQCFDGSSASCCASPAEQGYSYSGWPSSLLGR